MARYAVVIAAVVGLVVTALSGFVIIPALRRLKFGQNINDIGPTWHKNKQGVPTMGGIMFILGSGLGMLVAYPVLAGATTQLPGELGVVLLGAFTSLAFAAVGFIDDYLKVVHKQNLGLRELPKMLLQAIITIGFLVTLHMMGRLSTLVMLPFFGVVNFGILFYPISFVVIIGMVNAVNFTDGLDGLCTSVTLWVLCGYIVLLTIFDRAGLSLWAASVAGACVGFLLWNFYPAKVFMGDTGSMFLGGVVVTLGYCMGRPDVMILLGMVYIIELLSVVIQRVYFKLTKGKRLFKMTPIHHSFEMSGWSEVKIVGLFSFMALVFAVLAYIYAYLMG